MKSVRRTGGTVLILLALVVPAAGAQLDRGTDAPVKSPKLQAQLAEVAEAARQGGVAAGLRTARARGLDTDQGRVRVIVEGQTAAARSAVAAEGGTVAATAGQLTEALVPAGAMDALSRAAGVRYLRAPYASTPLATESEGVATSNADDWQAKGLRGAGAKIAVIDLGFAELAARQAFGDLPSVTQVDYCGGAMGAPEEHGTAVAEIVHEMAPSAQLFLICAETEVDLANGVAYAKANGITIVNHSVGWFNTSRGDGTGGAGTPDAIVADARANGILWVNAAGNSARTHWSGTFTDSNGDGRHEFAPGDVTNSSIPVANDDVICGFLKWDSWPATNQDFDLSLRRDSDLQIVQSSENAQTGSQPPVEQVCYTNPGDAGTFSFLIDRVSASASPRFDLVATHRLEYQVAAGSVLEPATAPGAFAVGAVCWQNTVLEPYSSRGPTIDGRTKPDLVGPSAVTSALYGPFTACATSGFTGTSSAAPHVAGAAGLLKAMFPLATADDLQAWLESNALDLAPAGKDTSTGAGALRLPTSAPSSPTTSVPAPGPEDTTYQSVKVTGTTAPNGLTTSYSWQYGPTTSYGSQTTPVALASPRNAQVVSAVLSGLTPATEYHYRLVAVNPFGTSFGQDRTQTTAPALPPDAETKAAQAIGATSARLEGSVSPHTAAATATFEWGETSAYGQSTAAVPAGTFGTNPVVTEIAGLKPNTAYHYRVVASNVHGTAHGADLTFTTLPPPSGGGGGGGGGGTADLAIEGTVQPATAGVGDDVTYVLRVTDVNGVLAQGVNVDVQLSGGSQLVGAVVDRGPGCAGGPLVCSLDFLSSLAPVATIRVQAKVTASGEQSLQATVRYALADVRPENNSVRIVVGRKAQIQAPGKPGGVAPRTTTGTSGANTLRGTARPDTLRGLGGNDRLFGAGGSDRLFGDAGHDWLDGGSGGDRLYGGSGNDRLSGGPGGDLYEGGSGNDVILARDRTRDTIRCGKGRDTVTADRVDAVARDCERVTRR